MLTFLKVYLALGIIVTLIGLFGLEERETSTFQLILIVLIILLLWPLSLFTAIKGKNKTDEELDKDVDNLVEILDEFEKLLKGES